MTYTLDTNILINLARFYPRDIFPRLWENIEESTAEGRSCICQAVLLEVFRGGDGLYDWAKDLPNFVCPPTEEELAVVAEIAHTHQEWVRGTVNEADPFVIAHAKIEGSEVVTEESRKGPGVADRNLKIPNVADEHGVEVLRFVDYVRKQGWTF